MYDRTTSLAEAVIGKELGLSRLMVARIGAFPSASTKFGSSGVVPVTDKWTYFKPKPYTIDTQRSRPKRMTANNKLAHRNLYFHLGRWCRRLRMSDMTEWTLGVVEKEGARNGTPVLFCACSPSTDDKVPSEISSLVPEVSLSHSS